MEVIQFALLGLGTGAVYTLLGQAIVLVHRGSDVLNFAAAAIGLFGAFIFYDIWNAGIAWPLAMLASLVSVAALGAVIYILVIRRLRASSSLSRIVATLGILTSLMAIETLAFAPNGQAVAVRSLLPTGDMTIGSIAIGWNYVAFALIGFAVTLALSVWSRRTRIGLATSAVAENELVAASMGLSPAVVSLVTWALGAMVAALGLILIAPVSGLSVQTLAYFVVPGLAAALVGNFYSFPLTLLGAMAMGVGQSELSRYVSDPGWSQAAPLLLIVLVLVARGTNLPGKGHVTGTLPSVGPGKITWRSLVWLGLGVVILVVISPNWLNAVTTTMLAALIVLSVVFITGYAGQLSLAQTALAGISAYLMALYSSYWGLPAWLSVLLSALAAVPAGLIMALPAIRTRGPNLAIATLTFVTVINALLLTDSSALGPVSIHEIPTLSVFGFDLSEFDQPRRFALLTLGSFALCVVGVSNVRRGRSGRRMLAVRSNERAAASMGISGPSIKLYAFGVGAFIAGLAGALTESQFFTADFSLYTVTSSVDSVLQAVIGGLGWASGPMVGAANATGGFSAMVISLFFSASSWLDLITGVGVILIILQSPDGLVPFNIRQFNAAMHRLRRGKTVVGSGRMPEKWLHPDAGEERTLTARRPPVRLVMNDITVRFGGQIALDRVNVTVDPGQIVGLIGPNGAGKSTLIDVATGFISKYSGSVLVDDVTMAARGPVLRARQGLARSFQGLELFDHMTVLDNLRVASDAVTPWIYCRDFVKPGSSPSSQVADVVHEFGLEPFLYSVPDELDYAHRRLVAIARALCSSPSILLLDEPAAGLDSNERQDLSGVIRSVVTSRGVGVLLVEHDVDFVFALCDSVVALDAGKVISTGVPRDVRRSPQVIDAYLGHAYVAASAVEGAGAERLETND